ncbi:MAG: preprotein translocase subunit SecD [Theionarchaea archaeon]|nr:preprotein translocase subunit SecD [Theionarchaea archaeon]
MSNIFKDIRVLILILAVIISLVATKPTYRDGQIDTDLQFGIELAGGSFIRLALEGCMVQIDVDMDTILQEEIETVLGRPVSILSSTEDFITFQGTQITEEEQKLLKDELGLQFSFYETNNIRLERSTDALIVWFLRQKTNSEVWKVEYQGDEYFEIRSAITEDTISRLLGENGSVTAYLEKVSPQTTKETRSIIENKLNYLGLQDIKVRVWGEDYIMVDMAGKSLEEARDIVSKPGKFEIKIKLGTEEDAETVFVVSGAEIARVDPPNNPPGSQWGVPFTFTDKGAQLFAEKCIEYGAASEEQEVRSERQVAMYLDDQEVFSASIEAGLAANIRDGTYQGQQKATTGDYERARELEIHLRAGALPVKPKIVGEGETPPELGAQFLRQVIQAIIGAILAVGVIIYIRYRHWRVVFPLLACAFSETLVVMGFAALINHQLDLASLAGVIATLGTGVDQMVIITDEVIRGEVRRMGSLLQRVSRAFSIIFVSAATTIIAMTPLAYMQLGVLRGFAIITIAGIFIGIFITRPAYGRLVTYAIKK